MSTQETQMEGELDARTDIESLADFFESAGRNNDCC